VGVNTVCQSRDDAENLPFVCCYKPSEAITGPFKAMNTRIPKPSDVERLLLPLFMQESVLPLRSGTERPMPHKERYDNLA
jgi:hypothetical protein